MRSWRVVRPGCQLSRTIMLMGMFQSSMIIVSLLSNPVNAITDDANWMADRAFQRSIDWRRQQQDYHHSMRNLRQANEKNVEEQADSETNSIDPEKHVDKFQEQQELVVHADAKVEEPEFETTEGQQHQHQGEQQKAAEEDSNTDENISPGPFVFHDPYLLGPTIKDWDEQRRDWLAANPQMKTTPDGKPRVLIVTGSQPDPCRSPVGDNFHIKSFKLKIDYARMHNYEIYYSFSWLDPLFSGVWVKLPVVRKLMLTHPEIEWFLWMDSDAVFTDLLFEPPLNDYDDYNMLMWGWEDSLYQQKSWVGFNAGVFILRNCQWSLDLIDKWSPMGPRGPVRTEFGKLLTEFLTQRREDYPADDQSALAYLLITDEAVRSKVQLIPRSFLISGWWVNVVGGYETFMEKYHPGLGNENWPWITHFTGCGPCDGDHSTPDYQDCIGNFTRAFNFAENQVLAYMGFQHESLSSSALICTRNDTDRPLDFVGVNPWEERIAQVAAAEKGTSF